MAERIIPQESTVGILISAVNDLIARRNFTWGGHGSRQPTDGWDNYLHATGVKIDSNEAQVNPVNLICGQIYEVEIGIDKEVSIIFGGRKVQFSEQEAATYVSPDGHTFSYTMLVARASGTYESLIDPVASREVVDPIIFIGSDPKPFLEMLGDKKIRGDSERLSSGINDGAILSLVVVPTYDQEGKRHLFVANLNLDGAAVLFTGPKISSALPHK